MARKKVNFDDSGLSPAAKQLVVDILDIHELSREPQQLARLRQAALVLTRIEQMEEALVGQNFTVLNRNGVTTIHPLVDQIRQQQSLFSQLLLKLDLTPDMGDEEAERLAAERSARARKAAQARWSARKGGSV